MGEVGKEGIRIESVRANMPVMKAYCYLPEESAKGELKASYGDEELEAGTLQKFGESGEGISYYLLIDQSGSIAPSYFEEMKSAVLQFSKNMGKKDDMTLIAFGNEVKVVCEGVSKEADLSDLVQPLKNSDENTLLFQAIQKTAELADKRKEKLKRKVAVVMTDGEDFSQNTATRAEALQALQEKGVPLYGMAVKERNNGEENPYIDGMGEFARSAGGVLEIFGEGEAGTKLDALQNLFRDAYFVKMKADSNRTSYTAKPLAITFGDGQIETTEVTAIYHKADKTAPEASVRKAGKRAFEVTFSEPMEHAGEKENYKVSFGEGEPLAVYDVSYQDEACRAKLVFEKELANGTYRVSFEHMTDRSMEENALTGVCAVKVTDGISGQAEEDTGGGGNAWIFLAAALAGILALLVLAAFLIADRRRKGMVTVEGKAVLMPNLEKKHHVSLEKKELPSQEIQFLFEGNKEPVKAEVSGSFFVGRSSICDLYIDDEKMSKQHFVLYGDGRGFEIEDLKSTNGTMVNGDRIRKKTRLKPGDKIKAGEAQMIVRW